MTAVWMVWAALCSAWLALAAWGVERVLLRGPGAVRFAWAGAMLLSLAVPAAALFRPSSPTPARPSIAPAGPAPGATALPELPPVIDATARRDVRAALARADRPLAAAWALASAALLARLLGGTLLLARRRRRWARRELLGVPVLVSERSGPAVVGVRRAAIVLPAWALALDEGRLALVLRHEREHLGARDALLLWGARLVVAAMPWSPALWWMLARLRGAVEIDCDARVLRASGAARVDARAYATLLLDVVRPDGERVVAGAPGFAERAAGLERRIRVMSARRRAAARGTPGAAAAIGATAVLLACEAPRPRGLTDAASDLPPLRDAAPLAAPLAAAAPRCDAIPWKGRTATVALLVDEEASGRVRVVARRGRGGATRAGYAPAGASDPTVACGASSDSGIVRFYGRDVFAAGGASAAPTLALEVGRMTNVVVTRGARSQVIAHLTVDPDTLGATPVAAALAWPDPRVAPSRGRVPTSVAAPRAGTVGAAAVRADTAASDPGLLARNLYDRLFRGIALGTAREPRARAVVARGAADALRLVQESSGTPWEGFRRATAMLDARDAALRALLVTDAERRAFDANAAALRP